MTESRKLAAVLAADVVGFSRLTGADEDRTLARLRALRSDLIDPTISIHKGRLVKWTGDGAIVEFRSVVEAVRCGIEIQNSMIERNAGLPPERRIELRIGIHLGDVVEESDGDLCCGWCGGEGGFRRGDDTRPRALRGDGVWRRESPRAEPSTTCRGAHLDRPPRRAR